MHCAYFAWLNDEGIPYNAAPGQKGIKSLRGMLAAQTGGGSVGTHHDRASDGGASRTVCAAP